MTSEHITNVSLLKAMVGRSVSEYPRASWNRRLWVGANGMIIGYYPHADSGTVVFPMDNHGMTFNG